MAFARRLLPFGLFFALASLLLWKVVFAGQVFVPAGLLRYLAPWTAEPRPPWNPLMYDSVGQFYPWRHFAAESLRSGTIPLWNPYEFCGTPFVANSQSAVLYPGNLLFYLLPTASAAGWSVILHLAVAGGCTYLFVRGLGLSRISAALAGIAYSFSTWQVSWLHLPTFLATSCWLPLVLHFTLRLRKTTDVRSACCLALAVGLTLLAGHLQIAFYVLLAAGLLAVLPRALDTGGEARKHYSRSLLIWLAAVALGTLLSMPQVLPSLELSRRSHRVAPATTQGYDAYTAYSASPAALVTLFVPDFFGNPSDPDNAYTGKSQGGQPFNYAEGAMYVGIPTLLLAAVGALEARKRSRLVGYFAALAILAMAMALGTALDALLYFYMPGFSQSGSPGRALVLWAFALSVLAAFGCEEVVGGRLSARGTAAAAVLVVLIAVMTLATALYSARDAAPAWHAEAVRAAIILAIGLALSVLASRRSGAEGARIAFLLPALLLADLFVAGIAYNPTSAPADVYPSTPLIQHLKARTGHDRIMPVNPRNFSFNGPNAVLPPNGAMVFGLRDVQGYDSLFTGQYKAFMNRLASPVDKDASPPEVGNMVFAKNAKSPLAARAGVRLIVSRRPMEQPGEGYIEGLYVGNATESTGRAHAPGGTVRWIDDGPTRVELEVSASGPTTLTLADEIYPGWYATVDGQPASIRRADDVFRAVDIPAGPHRVTFRYDPASFRIGLYLAFAALAACIGTIAARRAKPSGV